MPDLILPETGYVFDNWIRRLIHNPARTVGPYVTEGMRVLDAGCGRGMNSVAMARMVGDSGSVVSVDVRQDFIDEMMERARKAGVDHRIHAHLCEPDSMGVEGTFDFINAFWMAHETPDQRVFLTEVRAHLKPDGRFLLAEPKFHVKKSDYLEIEKLAQDVGFELIDHPRIRISMSALFARGDA